MYSFLAPTLEVKSRQVRKWNRAKFGNNNTINVDIQINIYIFIELYRPPIIDGNLAEELDAMGAVLLEGAKACGKTSSAEQAANSVIYMDDPVRRDQYL